MNDSSASLAMDLSDVAKTYGRSSRRIEALRGISLQVRNGEIFGLLGPNGAGKSTLVKILMTVVHPKRACGTVLGQKIGHKATLARIGYLPEHHRFPRYLTGRQMLEFFGSLSGVPSATARRRAGELLDLVGMSSSADRKLDGYSKGMLQRVGLAQALMNDPQLVLLDEPTDGVDPVGRKDILDLLRKLRADGRTIFVNSHLLGELEQICDRVAIMVKGNVVRQGTLAELASHRQWYEIELAPGCACPTDSLLPGIPPSPDGHTRGTLSGDIELEIHPRPEGAILRIGDHDAANVQPLLDQLRFCGCIIRRLELVQPSLEDLFMEAVRDPSSPAPEDHP